MQSQRNGGKRIASDIATDRSHAVAPLCTYWVLKQRREPCGSMAQGQAGTECENKGADLRPKYVIHQQSERSDISAGL